MAAIYAKGTPWLYDLASVKRTQPRTGYVQIRQPVEEDNPNRLAFPDCVLVDIADPIHHVRAALSRDAVQSILNASNHRTIAGALVVVTVCSLWITKDGAMYVLVDKLKPIATEKVADYRETKALLEDPSVSRWVAEQSKLLEEANKTMEKYREATCADEDSLIDDLVSMSDKPGSSRTSSSSAPIVRSHRSPTKTGVTNNSNGINTKQGDDMGDDSKLTKSAVDDDFVVRRLAGARKLDLSLSVQACSSSKRAIHQLMTAQDATPSVGGQGASGGGASEFASGEFELRSDDDDDDDHEGMWCQPVPKSTEHQSDLESSEESDDEDDDDEDADDYAAQSRLSIVTFNKSSRSIASPKKPPQPASPTRTTATVPRIIRPLFPSSSALLKPPTLSKSPTAERPTQQPLPTSRSPPKSPQKSKSPLKPQSQLQSQSQSPDKSFVGLSPKTAVASLAKTRKGRKAVPEIESDVLFPSIECEEAKELVAPEDKRKKRREKEGEEEEKKQRKEREAEEEEIESKANIVREKSPSQAPPSLRRQQLLNIDNVSTDSDSDSVDDAASEPSLRGDMSPSQNTPSFDEHDLAASKSPAASSAFAFPETQMDFSDSQDDSVLTPSVMSQSLLETPAPFQKRTSARNAHILDADPLSDALQLSPTQGRTLFKQGLYEWKPNKEEGESGDMASASETSDVVHHVSLSGASGSVSSPGSPVSRGKHGNVAAVTGTTSASKASGVVVAKSPKKSSGRKRNESEDADEAVMEEVVQHRSKRSKTEGEGENLEAKKAQKKKLMMEVEKKLKMEMERKKMEKEKKKMKEKATAPETQMMLMDWSEEEKEEEEIEGEEESVVIGGGKISIASPVSSAPSSAPSDTRQQRLRKAAELTRALSSASQEKRRQENLVSLLAFFRESPRLPHTDATRVQLARHIREFWSRR